jgi:hypothetical protein
VSFVERFILNLLSMKKTEQADELTNDESRKDLTAMSLNHVEEYNSVTTRLKTSKFS